MGNYGFLTAIFTGITAGIAVYNQVKIKQKVYTLWHNSDDCVCIDATICNYNKTPVCLYLDEDNVFLSRHNKYSSIGHGFILKSGSEYKIRIQCEMYIKDEEYGVVLLRSYRKGNKCILITLVRKADIFSNFLNKMKHMIAYYTNNSYSK